MAEKKNTKRRLIDDNDGELPSAPGDEAHRAEKVNAPRRESPSGPPHEPVAASRTFVPPELRAADAPVASRESVPMHERAAPGVEDNVSTDARAPQFAASHPPRLDGGDRLPSEMRMAQRKDIPTTVEVSPAIGPSSPAYNLDKIPGFVKKGERATGAPKKKSRSTEED